jgi:hypothetical protein
MIMFLRTLSSFFVTALVLATAATGCSAESDEDADSSEGAASTSGDRFATLSVARVEIDEQVTLEGRTEKLRCELAVTHLSVALSNAAAAAAINRVLTPRTSGFVDACRQLTGPQKTEESTRMVYNGAGVLSVKHDILSTQFMKSGPDRGRSLLISSYTGQLFDLTDGRLLGVRDVIDAGGLRVVEQACARDIANVYGNDALDLCRQAVASTEQGAMTFTFDQFQAHFWLGGIDGLVSMRPIDVPWSALRGHVLHPGVRKVPSTPSQEDICMGFPSCDGGDRKVGTSASQCLQDIGCYERTQCGRTIWCSDDT